METWKKIAMGAGAVVLLIGVSVLGVSWWSHKDKLAALDIQNPSPEEIVKIVSLLAEQDGKVLGRVHQKLQGIGKEATPALRAQLKKGDNVVRIEAARVLVEMDPDAYLEEIAPLIDPAVNKNADLRREFVSLVRGDLAKSDAGRAILNKAATDPDVLVTRVAAERIPTDEAGQATLQNLARSSDGRTSRHAARQLRERRQNRRR